MTCGGPGGTTVAGGTFPITPGGVVAGPWFQGWGPPVNHVWTSIINNVKNKMESFEKVIKVIRHAQKDNFYGNNYWFSHITRPMFQTSSKLFLVLKEGAQPIVGASFFPTMNLYAPIGTLGGIGGMFC